MMQWEAHKCFIRGQLLAISSRRKRVQQELILSLSSKICTLEAQHKRSRAIGVSQDLRELRAQLSEELFKRALRRKILSQRLFYEQGNKPGRLLARATQQRTLNSTIHHITSSAGQTYSKIAHQFQMFYEQLYNLQSGNVNPTRPTMRHAQIREFLNLYGPAALSDDNAQALEAPLSLEEFLAALKATKPGKSPGPDGFTAQYYKSFSDLLAPRFL